MVFVYKGPVQTLSGVTLVSNFEAKTRANNAYEAMLNLSYQFKKEYEQETGVRLGKILLNKRLIVKKT